MQNKFHVNYEPVNYMSYFIYSITYRTAKCSTALHIFVLGFLANIGVFLKNALNALCQSYYLALKISNDSWWSVNDHILLIISLRTFVMYKVSHHNFYCNHGDQMIRIYNCCSIKYRLSYFKVFPRTEYF